MSATNPATSKSTSNSNDTNLCPCGSGAALAACCLPFIEGKKNPDTAEQLLRARYTAFTRADVDYIVKTHHSKTRGEVKREEIEDWAKNSDWGGLQIVQREAGGPADSQGTLIFCARYTEKNGADGAAAAPKEHWEKSFFEKEDGQWRFLDAQGVHVGTYRRAEPKIGRNDPCPCGSGKKSKKCCAA